MDATLERFMSWVVKPETSEGCWLWTGSLDGSGYGRFQVNGRRTTAHRVAYGLLVGEVPDRLVVDHLCRVRHCVNPAHLEPVTQRENTLRSPIAPAAIRARATHCVNGHPFDEANTYLGPKRFGYPVRGCRACGRINSRRRRQERLQAAS